MLKKQLLRVQFNKLQQIYLIKQFISKNLCLMIYFLFLNLWLLLILEMLYVMH